MVNEIEVNGGASIILYETHDKSCQLISAFSYAGTIFPEHDHEESSEVMVVISGALKVVFPSSRPDEIVRAGKSIFISKCEKHAVIYLEDTRICAVICPPDMDFYSQSEKKKDADRNLET